MGEQMMKFWAIVCVILGVIAFKAADRFATDQAAAVDAAAVARQAQATGRLSALERDLATVPRTASQTEVSYTYETTLAEENEALAQRAAALEWELLRMQMEEMLLSSSSDTPAIDMVTCAEGALSARLAEVLGNLGQFPARTAD
jgi:Skp family chaperone for outer membrane proteins